MARCLPVCFALVLFLTQVLAESARADESSTNVGYDVSYKDCDTPLPSAFGYALVNVNHGRPFTLNQCLSAQVAWAATGQSPTQPLLSFYMNTSNPGPMQTAFWPTAGAGPAPCDGSWSAECAYDFGWLSAQDAFLKAAGTVGTSAAAAAAWWLDVETANSWSEDQALNVRILIGASDGLRTQGVTKLGIYATKAHWMEITGASGPASPLNAPFDGMPNWIPRLGSVEQAATDCSSAESLTGGPVELVQFEFYLDKNYACGL